MEIIIVDPIPPLDEHRPARLPILPQWLERLSATLKKAIQPDLDGRYREVHVLPSILMPNQVQRSAIEGHISDLVRSLQMKPGNDRRSAARTMAAVSKMILVLTIKSIEDVPAEAKMEAYGIALSDVSCWAVEEVVRGWYRGRYKSAHDSRWMPDPATFHELACGEEVETRNRVRQLKNLLRAEAAVEHPEEHRLKMLELFKGLSLLLRDQREGSS